METLHLQADIDFKNLLDKLKLSSREAIVNGEKDSLDSLKRYLHINRPVEQDFSQLIIHSFHSDKAQLLLIIGNVGDGKSHLLAKMWEKHPMEMHGYRVHNDATESLSRHKSYLDTLTDLLQPYSDAEIHLPHNRTKTVIAINLGTLTNFLDEKGESFGHLKNFIGTNRILQDDGRGAGLQEDDHLHFINLADYHIYSLTEEGPFSRILLDVITKVTNQKSRNPFYQAYQEFYSRHPAPGNCPIKYNYDLLGQEQVKARVVQVLIETIVKHKLIVSVRLIMNLIYDLIVPPAFSSLNGKGIMERSTVIKGNLPFYKYTLPWLLFDSANTSGILKHINKLDPLASTNEALDHLIIKLGTTAYPNNFFSERGLIAAGDRLFEELSGMAVLDRIKLYIRLNFLLNKVPEFIVQDNWYMSFMKELYYYHSNQKQKLITLYQKTQRAIYHWNGTLKLEEGYLHIEMGRPHNSYKVSQKVQLELAPGISQAPKSGPLDRFANTLILGFKVNGSEDPFQVKVDYGLYILLMSINKGYRANAIDKSNHVDFKQFVNKLAGFQAQNKDVIIQEVRGAHHKKFKLTFTPGFDIFQFEEIQ